MYDSHCHNEYKEKNTLPCSKRRKLLTKGTKNTSRKGVTKGCRQPELLGVRGYHEEEADISAQGRRSDALTEGCGQDNDHQNDRKDDEQTARFIACVLLIPTGTAELDIRAAGVTGNILDILADGIHLGTLLVDDMPNISEQLVQFANALLDVADLGLAFDDQRLLEVHLSLVRKTRPLLLQELLLLLLLMGLCFRPCELGIVKSSTCSNCRRALLL